METPFDYFQIEAAERLERMGKGLMALEQAPDDGVLITDLFREAHSLKGAAGLSGLADISEVCHGMEDVLSVLREGSRTAGPAVIDVLLAATDAVADLLAAHVEDRADDVSTDAILERLIALADPAAEPATPQEPGPRADSEAEVPAEAARAESRPPPATAGTETVRLRVDMLEALANLTGELMVAADRLRPRLCRARERPSSDGSTSAHRNPVEGLAADLDVIEPLIEEIHQQVLGIRMLPLSVLFDELPRFVRDHCRQEGKQAELLVEGDDLRADRQVLEQLRDPIIHLIRNAVSHGIETAQERERRGKSPSGVVRLTTSRHGDRIRITCEDDGRGIDRQAVLDKAITTGLITAEEAEGLDTRGIEELILRPGFSTAKQISDVSGRGVGMDVVAARVEALRGSLEIESRPGELTRFVLELPASVATFEGLLLEAAENTYVIPMSSIVRVATVAPDELQTAGGRAMVELEGESLPLLALASLVGRPPREDRPPPSIPFVVVRHRGQRLAVGIDRILGTRTIVAKGLGDHLPGVPGVSGATILGTGLPALVLEPGLLVGGGGSSISSEGWSPRRSGAEEEPDDLLVVDDSLTTRMMEKSILEAAGYGVEVAVSAEDALAKAEVSTYRLFVVDVEMPGLNGFQLTRRLRQDPRHADTPIIIVTSLATDENRLEGLEAGANAYIVKGEFDQDVLLKTVERLVVR